MSEGQGRSEGEFIYYNSNSTFKKNSDFVISVQLCLKMP